MSYSSSTINLQTSSRLLCQLLATDLDVVQLVVSLAWCGAGKMRELSEREHLSERAEVSRMREM